MPARRGGQEDQKPPLDWKQIYNNLFYIKQYVYIKNNTTTLLLDESQDYPTVFFECLKLMYRKYIIFIDARQQIQSSFHINLDTKIPNTEYVKYIYKLSRCTEHQTLWYNQRNTRSIHAFASAYQSLETNDLRENPRLDAGVKPVLWTFINEQDMWYDVIKRCHSNIYDSVGNLLPTLLQKSIAIVCEEKRERTRTNIKINKCRELFGFQDLHISVYENHQNPSDPVAESQRETASEFGSGKKGNKLLTAANLKGLEFDIMLVVNFDLFSYNTREITDENVRQMYVLSSRAKEEVHFYQLDGQLPPILDRAEGLFDKQMLQVAPSSGGPQ